MGSHTNRVCIWSQWDLNNWQIHKISPNCLHHEHISRPDARELVQTFLFRECRPDGKPVFHYEAMWIEGSGIRKWSVIVMNDPRMWAIRRSENYDVKQLVRVGR